MLESINTGTSSNRIFDQIQQLKFNLNKQFLWYLSYLALNLSLYYKNNQSTTIFSY